MHMLHGAILAFSIIDIQNAYAIKTTRKWFIFTALTINGQGQAYHTNRYK